MMYLRVWMTVGAGLLLLAFVAVTAHVGSVLVVAIAAFAVFALIELLLSTWVVRHWDEWEAKVGAKTRTELDGWRDRRIMGRLVAGATSRSALSYSAAAAVLGPIVALTTARLLNGHAVARSALVGACVGRGGLMALLVVVYGLTLGAAGTRF